MPLLALPFPKIDPVLVQLGPFAIRWYALSYIAGLILGWWLIRRLVRADELWGDSPRPTPDSIDDLLVYCAVGVIVGGRLGNVLFYDPGFYFAHPIEIFKIWEGGMAFHGGLIGASCGIIAFAWRYKTPVMTVFDLACLVAPIGIFFGRIANFIKPELWGRPLGRDLSRLRQWRARASPSEPDLRGPARGARRLRHPLARRALGRLPPAGPHRRRLRRALRPGKDIL
jgi:phosphatidylglycerol:prolipoprotein diacylglycerol transferase